VSALNAVRALNAQNATTASQLERAAARARVLRGCVVPAALVALWYLTTELQLVNRHLVARPDAVLRSAIEQFQAGAIVQPLIASLSRNALGFALGSIGGIALGGLMGMSRAFDRLLGPTFHASKQVAIFAWIPLMSVWLGSGEPAKVAFIALSAFYPVVLCTHEGVRGVAREYFEVAQAYRFTRWQVIRRVVWPAALPAIFGGLQLALIYAWLGTLGAEFLLAPADGIGNLMIDGRLQFAMDKVLLGVLIAGLVGASLNALAQRIERRVLRWRVSGL
jgi:sulfonate transport system permease protein